MLALCAIAGRLLVYMTDGFDDREFDEFLAVGIGLERRTRNMAAARERFKGFLTDRGVQFEDMETAPVDERGAVLLNTLEVGSLAMAWAEHTDLQMTGQPLSPLEETEFKQRQQAKTIVRGLSPAWRELIDHEFPGQPLDPADIDLLAEVSADDMRDQEQQRAKQQAAREQIDEFLKQQGITQLTLKAERFVQSLVLIKSVSLERMNPSYIEEARLLMIKTGLRGQVWMLLIDSLLTV
jgi:hypothetical protein